MKANPGGTITGEGIIGRSAELNEIWSKISKRSIVLSAERRVGKTSLLRKMQDDPRPGWTPLLVFVESARRPIDCVEAIYDQAVAANLHSNKGIWTKRLLQTCEKLTGGQFNGWKMPQLQADWRRLLKLLVEDLVEHGDTNAILMLDEFPMMVWQIGDDHGPALAMQFLDALREIRQKFEASGKLRFIFSGSIGFHLVLQHLKLLHGYKGAPTNDTHLFVLGGLSPNDTELMCGANLDDEKIVRKTAQAVADRMYYRTDGLPLYIQYVCEAMQDSGATEIVPARQRPIPFTREQKSR